MAAHSFYTNKPITNAKYLADHATVQPKTSQGYWIDIAVGQEIAAKDRLFKMDLGRVAFPFGVNRGVDTALGANRMRPFARHQRKEVDGKPSLRKFYGGHEPAQTAANDQYLVLSHGSLLFSQGEQSAHTHHVKRHARQSADPSRYPAARVGCHGTPADQSPPQAVGKVEHDRGEACQIEP